MITVKIYKPSGESNLRIVKSNEADPLVIPADQIRMYPNGDNLDIHDALIGSIITKDLPYTQFQDEAGADLGASIEAVVAAIGAIQTA